MTISHFKEQLSQLPMKYRQQSAQKTAETDTLHETQKTAEAGRLYEVRKAAEADKLHEAHKTAQVVAGSIFSRSEEEIYTFMPFSKDAPLEPHILYIGCSTDLLLHESKLTINFLCLLDSPEQIVSECTKHYPNANFIFIIWDHNLSKQPVYDTTTRIFLAENRYTSQINRLVAASNTNRGLQYLIDEAYRINKSPIIVMDSSYRILAMYGDLPADEIFDLSAQRQLGYITEHNLERMKRDKIFEQLRHSDTNLHYGKASDSDFFWADTLVYIHGIEVAEIGVIEYDHQFTNYDFEFIHFLSQLVAWEMQKKNFSTPHHSQMHSIFLSELLEQRLINPKAVELRRRMLGWSEPKFLYILSIFSSAQQRDFLKKAEVFSAQLSRLMPNCHWTIKGDHLVLIIMKDNHLLDEFLPHSPLSERLKRSKMYGILSNCFSDLSDAKKYYEQTLNVKEYKTYFSPDTPISFYTDFYIYHIAKIISETNELKDFCHPLIHEIQAYDNENHTNYLETLAEYLTHIDNPSLSAQNLCIHKNTFFYRMNKLKELFSVDLKDGIERMKLLLTIEFMKLEK